MKFAFLVHPITEETRTLSEFDPSGQVRRSWGHDLRNYCLQTHLGALEVARRSNRMREDVRVMDELTGLVSAQGMEAVGRLYEIPMDAADILASPSDAMAFVEEAVDQAACWGARIAGLGSLTGIIGGQGTYLAEKSHIPVTTGDSLEVFAAIENLNQVCREVEIDLAEESIAVIGVPNGIATAAARILLPKCKRLMLVSLQKSGRAKRVAVEMGAELATDMETALSECRIVVAATASGDCIDQEMLRSGAVVIDVAVPTDVRGDSCLREDTLVVSGGLTRIPRTMALDSNYLWFHHGMVPSCLAETMILALEDRAECFSLGRTLGDEAISEIGRLAKWHGFEFSRLFSFGLPMDETALVRYRKALAHAKSTVRNEVPLPFSKRSLDSDVETELASTDAEVATGDVVAASGAPPHVEELAPRAEILHARHIDPLLVAFGERSNSTKTFVRGEGVYLWDENQKPFLDIHGGGGSLNLGHNHPAVVEAIKQALRDAAPGAVAGAVNPLTAALAERLVALAPDNLEMASFVNSGSEAVEAALRLAILATGRSGILHLEGACHGKSLGALAVSGERNQRQRLGVDLAGARNVTHDDLEQLERELASRDYAAFIVEPLGVESGMRQVSNEYFSAASELCRKHGTLLVLDEAQTALGRLGSMLAVERLGIEADVVTLAKSLGGGMVPVGAVLSSRDLWKRAYGTIQTNDLAHSTLAAGSLASAAGLATLDTIKRDSLGEAALARGRQMCQGLEAVCQRHKYVRSVHGEGLLLALEFEPIFPALRTHWKELEEAKLSPYLIPNVDDMLAGLSALFAMQALLEGHQVFTQVSKTYPTFLRIHPPLTISAEEVARFLDALDICCREYGFVAHMTGESIAKAGLGEHRGNRRADAKSDSDENNAQRSAPAGTTNASGSEVRGANGREEQSETRVIGR